MTSTMRPASLTLLFGLAIWSLGCSDDSTGSNASDTNVEDVTPTDVGADVAVEDTSPIPDTLCETLWTRAKSCGHTTTFPGFEAWCAGDGQGVRAELEVCKVKPCALLVTCLDEAGAPSQGL